MQRAASTVGAFNVMERWPPDPAQPAQSLAIRIRRMCEGRRRKIASNPRPARPGVGEVADGPEPAPRVREGFPTPGRPESTLTTDPLTPNQRSALMARIRSKDTQPELVVRRLVWSLGFRYRLHQRDLPGRPDIVLRRHRKAIFVHGCFWHAHKGCPRATVPKTRRDFWTAKFQGNRRRDAASLRALRRDGWKVLVLWECELKDRARLSERVGTFLAGPGAAPRCRRVRHARKDGIAGRAADPRPAGPADSIPRNGAGEAEGHGAGPAAHKR